MRIVACFIILYSFETLAVELPAGWRLPTAKELAGESLRNDLPLKDAHKHSRFETDLNNDGKLDHVYLLKSSQYPGEGLFVKLSTPTGYEWQLLDRVEWGAEYADTPLMMRIDLAKPGSYKTACALGHWQCGPDEPTVLKLERAAIWQNRFDDATAIWYWDNDDQIIKKVWLGGP